MMLGCWGLREVRGGGKFLNLRYLSEKILHLEVLFLDHVPSPISLIPIAPF